MTHPSKVRRPGSTKRPLSSERLSLLGLLAKIKVLAVQHLPSPCSPAARPPPLSASRPSLPLYRAVRCGLRCWLGCSTTAPRAIPCVWVLCPTAVLRLRLSCVPFVGGSHPDDGTVPPLMIRPSDLDRLDRLVLSSPLADRIVADPPAFLAYCFSAERPDEHDWFASCSARRRQDRLGTPTVICTDSLSLPHVISARRISSTDTTESSSHAADSPAARRSRSAGNVNVLASPSAVGPSIDAATSPASISTYSSTAAASPTATSTHASFAGADTGPTYADIAATRHTSVILRSASTRANSAASSTAVATAAAYSGAAARPTAAAEYSATAAAAHSGAAASPTVAAGAHLDTAASPTVAAEYSATAAVAHPAIAASSTVAAEYSATAAAAHPAIAASSTAAAESSAAAYSGAAATPTAATSPTATRTYASVAATPPACSTRASTAATRRHTPRSITTHVDTISAATTNTAVTGRARRSSRIPRPPAARASSDSNASWRHTSVTTASTTASYASSRYTRTASTAIAAATTAAASIAAAAPLAAASTAAALTASASATAAPTTAASTTAASAAVASTTATSSSAAAAASTVAAPIAAAAITAAAAPIAAAASTAATTAAAAPSAAAVSTAASYAPPRYTRTTAARTHAAPIAVAATTAAAAPSAAAVSTAASYAPPRYTRTTAARTHAAPIAVAATTAAAAPSAAATSTAVAPIAAAVPSAAASTAAASTAAAPIASAPIAAAALTAAAPIAAALTTAAARRPAPTTRIRPNTAPQPPTARPQATRGTARPRPPGRTIIATTASPTQAAWIARFATTADAAQLDAALAALISEVLATQPEPARRPSPRRDAADPARQRRRRRSGPQYDAADAARIQRLYRANRPRAFREITTPPSPYCQLSKEQVQAHFADVLKRRTQTDTPMPPAVPQLPPPSPEDQDPLSDEFTPSEVWGRLCRCPNTAPGPDTLRYNTWKAFDPRAYVLSAVFNTVRRLQHVPAAWKQSTTILLHKKGEQDDIGNWRPIALSDTVGKLYASCLASRLTNWCLRHERISPTQKGFMPYEGCLEHSFTLQSIIQDARRRRQHTALAWLDLRNAFGSVPHDTIFKCLAWAGLNTTSIDIIRRLYDGCSTAVRVTEGLTEKIRIGAGVKQGCPLSPIVFNIAIEPILRAINAASHGYNIQGQKIAVLAYADDLVLTTDSAADLQSALNITTTIASWAGLTFNARKCASLHIDGKRHTALSTRFTIQDEPMAALAADGLYEHLGVPTGYAIHRSAADTLKTMTADVNKIDASLLAPWQKFDAVNTFVLSRLSYHLKAGSVPKKSLDVLDKTIKAVGKKWLNLPQRAGAEPLYLSYKQGGVNLLPTNMLADVAQLAHALRLLTSNDPAIEQLALATLKAVVKKKIRREVEEGDVSEYLNGSTSGVFCVETSDTTSMWTRLRSATRRLRSKIDVCWQHSDGSINLLLDGAVVSRGQVESRLRDAVRAHYLHRLLAKPDQGKVYDVTSTTTAANHFMRAGNYTRFAEWRFIHRARLDVLPLNGARRFGPPGVKNCRRSITKRHNAILDRLTKAMRRPEAGSVLINQQLPGYDGRERPDIIVLDDAKKTAFIADVTVAFENRQAAFSMARAEKHRKYEALAQHLRNQGYETAVDAFVIGSLGGYDPANAPTLNQLGIGHRYSILMKRLMVSDTIRWSRDIYVEHVCGQRQY
uniref:Reverse transcriptase domain-containing protein n=1 Tax=Plectus sambesii TaxID=2011161 RepID=A0A914WV51_9BILA